MTAVIITCRSRPILVSRWRLVTYKRLVSVFSRNLNILSWLMRPTSRSRALTTCAHPWLLVVHYECNCVHAIGITVWHCMQVPYILSLFCLSRCHTVDLCKTVFTFCQTFSPSGSPAILTLSFKTLPWNSDRY